MKIGFATALLLSLIFVAYFTAKSLSQQETDWGLAIEFGFVALGLWLFVNVPLAGFTAANWRRLSTGFRVLGLIPLIFPVMCMFLVGGMEEIIRSLM